MATETCARCGYVIATIAANETFDADGAACPGCGAAQEGLFTVEMAEGLTFHEKLKTAQRRSGQVKPERATVVGDDLHRVSGEWRSIDRVIDRKHDEYHEVVRDSSGETIHECHERLSEHRGHGAARCDPG